MGKLSLVAALVPSLYLDADQVGLSGSSAPAGRKCQRVLSIAPFLCKVSDLTSTTYIMHLRKNLRVVRDWIDGSEIMEPSRVYISFDAMAATIRSFYILDITEFHSIVLKWHFQLNRLSVFQRRVLVP